MTVLTDRRSPGVKRAGRRASRPKRRPTRRPLRFRLWLPDGPEVLFVSAGMWWVAEPLPKPKNKAFGLALEV
jgi:hypothetical protein